jgi:uncharacterized protein (TIGR02266 family)
LADPNTRTGKRTPVTLKIKFKSETLEQFIERYAVDVSQGGIFIRTKEPLAVGTQMRFEFQLRDASPLIGGEGTVVWTRENDPSRPAIAPGMGVRFDRLAEGSQAVLERILAEKAKQAPNRPASDSIKPPLFTDQPTRVAPVQIQDLLLGAEKPRRNVEDPVYSYHHTLLPKPLPFATESDEVPDEAFEEPTKVRALDELVAQTAEEAAAAGTPAPTSLDELAARRGRTDSKAPEPAAARSPFPDAESIPGLPPEPEAPPQKPGRLLDATPSPRTEAPTTPPAISDTSPAPVKTKLGLGLEAPRMQTPSAVPLAGNDRGSGPSVGGPMTHGSGGHSAPRGTAAAAEPTAPVRMIAPAKRSSGAAIAILILVVLAVGAAGVWFFVLRDKAGPGTGSGTGSGSAPIATGSGSDSGSGQVAVGSGSEVPPAGSGSSQIATGPGSGSGKVEAPKGPVVDTVIEANVPKARVEVIGTDQRGDAPFTAKLEKDKSYKVRVSAPTFSAIELDLVGGAPKHSATLVPKPRVLSIKTDPPNALIVIDNTPSTGTKLTPQDIELTKAQAAKKSIRVRLFKNGFKALEKTVAADAFVEDDTRMVATLEEKLTAAPKPPGGGSAGQTGSGGTPTGGSATPPDGDGSATAPPPPPPPPPPPTGGSGEPEPNL